MDVIIDAERRQRERLSPMADPTNCMRTDPNWLLVLGAVATTGSVAAATRQLNLVPSGVSQHALS